MNRQTNKIMSVAKYLNNVIYNNLSIYRNIASQQLRVIHRDINKFKFCSKKNLEVAIAHQKITIQIQTAKNLEQLKNVYFRFQSKLNIINRTALLQKITRHPFDVDSQFIETIIEIIKKSWNQQYVDPDQHNSRAIANTICYMSRKVKRHNLDQQFQAVDYFQLFKHLNHKQFVMTITGLLKLGLIEDLQHQHSTQNKKASSIEQLIMTYAGPGFFPGLLVSLWFNLLKFQKSTPVLNDFFANLLQYKHFKNSLVDYMQMIYCYVNSKDLRTIELNFPIITFPIEENLKHPLGAHQLSVLFQQLAKLKKIKDVYFSQSFISVLHRNYLLNLNEKDIPLRNVANVFNSLIVFGQPEKTILNATQSIYYSILKNEIKRGKSSSDKKSNVDALSFVSLFNQLLTLYNPSQNQYLKQLIDISLQYVQKILNDSRIIIDYNQKTFIRLFLTLDQSKKKIEQYHSTNLQISQTLKRSLQKEIIKRNFQQKNIGLLMSYTFNLEIKSKILCRKFKASIQKTLKNQNLSQSSLQFGSQSEKINKKCILSKQGKNCLNCFV